MISPGSYKVLQMCRLRGGRPHEGIEEVSGTCPGTEPYTTGGRSPGAYGRDAEGLTRPGRDHRDESRAPVVLGMAPPHSSHTNCVVRPSKTQRAPALSFSTVSRRQTVHLYGFLLRYI